jgi:hypothetical protein
MRRQNPLYCSQRTLCSLLVWAVTALKGVAGSSAASIVKELR